METDESKTEALEFCSPFYQVIIKADEVIKEKSVKSR